MARMRTIKPSFFTNDLLAQVHPLGRILFAGLWCIADRAGRLEDRPQRIKIEVLPYDKANVDRLLEELASRGFIIRYESGGQRFVQIVNFDRHQSPHMKEPASTIPAPGEHRASTITAPVEPSGIWDPGSRSGIRKSLCPPYPPSDGTYGRTGALAGAAPRRGEGQAPRREDRARPRLVRGPDPSRTHGIGHRRRNPGGARKGIELRAGGDVAARRGTRGRS